MTVARRDGNEPPFNQWLREHPELESLGNRISATDSDIWCHRYSLRDEKKRQQSSDVRDTQDSIMLVEIKSHSHPMPYAQRDTLTVVDALLRMSCMRPDGRRIAVKIDDARLGGRRVRQVRCFGVHLLQMSDSRPDNSEKMLWDNRFFPQETHLIELLRFERDPDAPSRLLNTRRHHAPSARLHTAQLFPITGGGAA